jgi:hypothetical protein
MAQRLRFAILLDGGPNSRTPAIFPAVERDAAHKHGRSRLAETYLLLCIY